MADRHSEKQKKIPLENIPVAIQDALREIQFLLNGEQVECYTWNKLYIAASFNLKISLPTRGPVNGIDIRPIEPVLLLFNIAEYPFKPPIADSDRQDFPIHLLPHLNPGHGDDLASLCLHRGNMDDWFAEHSLKDYLERVRGWFQDAAANTLIPSGDAFEWTRINKPLGISVYVPSELTRFVEGQWQATSGKEGFGLTLMSILRSDEVKKFTDNKFSYRTYSVSTSFPSEEILELFKTVNKNANDIPGSDKLLFGLLIWTKQNINRNYFGKLPKNLAELKEFSTQLEVPLEEALHALLSKGGQLFCGIPVSISFLRPTKILGTESPIEILNFVILASDEYFENGKLKDEAPVEILSHRNPLSASFASFLSNESNEKNVSFAVLGCGALGSKISLHLARSGFVQQSLIDYADLAPHHLVRHALSSQYIGQNKAKSIQDYIQKMFTLDIENIKIEAFAESINSFLQRKDVMEKITIVIDASASSAVLNRFVSADAITDKNQYSRCEIADEGRLGLFYWEGKERNPRIDDLQIFLFNLAREELILSEWLKRHACSRANEQQAALEEIGIGVSCSSTTLKLADDVISLHGAHFSRIYKKTSDLTRNKDGKILLSALSLDSKFQAEIKLLNVPAVIINKAKNDQGWEIRMFSKAQEKILESKRRAWWRETGGLLLGQINKKRKIIYVTDALTPSRDSRLSAYAFRRGREDYPKMLNDIHLQTGNLIGYVGEWHTHPCGKAMPSAQDMKAVSELKKNLQPAGIPAHIMIAGTDGIASFVF